MRVNLLYSLELLVVSEAEAAAGVVDEAVEESGGAAGDLLEEQDDGAFEDTEPGVDAVPHLEAHADKDRDASLEGDVGSVAVELSLEHRAHTDAGVEDVPGEEEEVDEVTVEDQPAAEPECDGNGAGKQEDLPGVVLEGGAGQEFEAEGAPEEGQSCGVAKSQDRRSAPKGVEDPEELGVLHEGKGNHKTDEGDVEELSLVMLLPNLASPLEDGNGGNGSSEEEVEDANNRGPAGHESVIE